MGNGVRRTGEERQGGGHFVASELCSPGKKIGEGGGRLEKERESAGLTLNFRLKFELCSKKFEYQSYSKFRELQLWFYRLFHLILSF